MGNNSGTMALTPAKRRYRALADMAASHGVVNGVKKSKSQQDMRNLAASKPIQQKPGKN